MSIGILGGTFDPPHIGHLLLAETAREQLGLSKVLFVPAGQPVHKPDQPITPAELRVEMTRQAIAGHPQFQLDTIDVDRPPPHYTATLLPLLHDQYPHETFQLLLGGDSLRDILSWHRPEAILAQYKLAVLHRPGADINWDSLTTALPALPHAVTILDGPTVSISATQIRRWAAAGRSLRYLTPPPVLKLIQEFNLYR